MRHVTWVMLLVLGIAAINWWGFFQQIILGKPWGSNPASDFWMWVIWLIFGVGFPLGFYWMHLLVVVREDNIHINFFPLTKRNIRIGEIKSVNARSYRPLGEYGGWGIRGFSGRRAYSIKGKQGVEVELHTGQIIMIGSQNAAALQAAIQERLSP